VDKAQGQGAGSLSPTGLRVTEPLSAKGTTPQNEQRKGSAMPKGIKPVNLTSNHIPRDRWNELTNPIAPFQLWNTSAFDHAFYLNVASSWPVRAVRLRWKTHFGYSSSEMTRVRGTDLWKFVAIPQASDTRYQYRFEIDYQTSAAPATTTMVFPPIGSERSLEFIRVGQGSYYDKLMVFFGPPGYDPAPVVYGSAPFSFYQQGQSYVGGGATIALPGPWAGPFKVNPIIYNGKSSPVDVNYFSFEDAHPASSIEPDPNINPVQIPTKGLASFNIRAYPAVNGGAGSKAIFGVANSPLRFVLNIVYDQGAGS
jgi:hypothetical protein